MNAELQCCITIRKLVDSHIHWILGVAFTSFIIFTMFIKEATYFLTYKNVDDSVKHEYINYYPFKQKVIFSWSISWNTKAWVYYWNAEKKGNKRWNSWLSRHNFSVSLGSIMSHEKGISRHIYVHFSVDITGFLQSSISENTTWL